MSDTVRGLAAVAEQAAEDAGTHERANALANRWGEMADGENGVAVILAALIVQRLVTAEIAQGCECSQMDVMATVLGVLARVSGAKE